MFGFHEECAFITWSHEKHAIKMAERKESVFDYQVVYIILITICSNDYIIRYACQLIIAIVMITIILHQ